MPNRGIRSESIGDGVWIVKGTTDTELARQELATRHVRDLTVSDARWFRIVPAHPHDPCGLDHTHHLVPDKENRQGAFPAVIFTPPHGVLQNKSRNRRPGIRRWG